MCAAGLGVGYTVVHKIQTEKMRWRLSSRKKERNQTVGKESAVGPLPSSPQIHKKISKNHKMKRFLVEMSSATAEFYSQML